MNRCFLIFLIALLAPSSAFALRNPAAVYCAALGYEYRIESSAQGDTGYCVFSSGEKVDAWKFLRGEVAKEKNYCATRGFSQKIVRDPKICLRLLSNSCLICDRGDGNPLEVTQMMGLVLEETTCGDGVCGLPETNETCPKDCPSNRSDNGKPDVTR